MRLLAIYGATEKVLIAIPDSQMETITTDKTKIEQVLFHQNKKITATYSSSFLQDPLILEIDQEANTENAKKILMEHIMIEKFSPKIPKTLSNV